MRDAISKSLVQLEAHVLAPKLSRLLWKVDQFSKQGAYCNGLEIAWATRDVVRVAQIMLELKEAIW